MSVELNLRALDLGCCDTIPTRRTQDGSIIHPINPDLLYQVDWISLANICERIRKISGRIESIILENACDSFCSNNPEQGWQAERLVSSALDQYKRHNYLFLKTLLERFLISIPPDVAQFLQDSGLAIKLIKPLKKAVFATEKSEIAKYVGKIIEIYLTDAIDANHPATVRYLNQIITILFPSNQFLSDQLCLAIYSKEHISKHNDYQFERIRRYLCIPNNDAPDWVRPLLDSDYLRYGDSGQIYVCCRIEADQPFDTEGCRLYKRGKIILGLALKAKPEPKEIAVPLDLSDLEMDFEETRKFLDQIGHFISSLHEDIEKTIASSFDDFPYVKEHPKREIVASIFTTFLRETDRAVDELFSYVLYRET